LCPIRHAAVPVLLSAVGTATVAIAVIVEQQPHDPNRGSEPWLDWTVFPATNVVEELTETVDILAVGEGELQVAALDYVREGAGGTGAGTVPSDEEGYMMMDADELRDPTDVVYELTREGNPRSDSEPVYLNDGGDDESGVPTNIEDTQKRSLNEFGSARA